MTNLVKNFDNATVLSEKFLDDLYEHDVSLVGGLLADVYLRQKRRSETVTSLLSRVREWLLSFQVDLSSSQVEPKKPTILVIGRPRNQFFYVDMVYEQAVQHYLLMNGLTIFQYLSDDTIQVSQITNWYFRASEVYHIADSGVVEHLSKAHGLTLSKFPEYQSKPEI